MMFVALPQSAAQGARERVVYVVAPSGQKGGGMGRVKDYILGSFPDAGGIHFEALDTRGDGAAWYSIVLMARAILRIWSSAGSRKAAFVHVNVGDRGSLFRKGVVILACRAVGVPVVAHLHAVLIAKDHASAGALIRWLIAQPFRVADCCIVLGDIWRNWLVEAVGVESRKVVIIYNGVDIPRNDAIRQFTQTGRVRQILFLGNLLERKGLTDLLVALSKVPPTTPAWHATIAGGGDIDHYKTVAREHGIAERVSFPGWVDQIGARQLLSQADVLVLPSYDEGLPLVILEALGSGTPVICTPVGSIPEVLRDGTHALFVAPGNIDALAANVTRVLTDAQLQQNLSREGLRLFDHTFSLGVFARKLADVYRASFGVELQSAFGGECRGPSKESATGN